METEHYFTLLLAFVELKTGKVSLAQAGHPHPVVQRNDGDIEQNGCGGFPVGLISGITFEECEFTLRKGDRLIIVSDGVTECPDPSGELLDDEGFAALVQRNADVGTKDFFEALVWDLTDYAGDMNFPDDVSGVLFEYSGQVDFK